MMESYLNENFVEELLQRWRNLCSIVKNPKRWFRFTANLSKRYEAAAMRRTNQAMTSQLTLALHTQPNDPNPPSSQKNTIWIVLAIIGFMLMSFLLHGLYRWCQESEGEAELVIGEPVEPTAPVISGVPWPVEPIAPPLEMAIETEMQRIEPICPSCRYRGRPYIFHMQVKLKQRYKAAAMRHTNQVMTFPLTSALYTQPNDPNSPSSQKTTLWIVLGIISLILVSSLLHSMYRGCLQESKREVEHVTEEPFEPTPPTIDGGQWPVEPTVPTIGEVQWPVEPTAPPLETAIEMQFIDQPICPSCQFSVGPYIFRMCHLCGYNF